uniref:Hint domain-containing protein n=1 Tax=Parascaris univalens TaxID=6257 RepID=A0A915BDH2_PARUN
LYEILWGASTLSQRCPVPRIVPSNSKSFSNIIFSCCEKFNLLQNLFFFWIHTKRTRCINDLSLFQQFSRKSRSFQDDSFKVITMKPAGDVHQSEVDKIKEEMIKALSPTSAPPGTRVLTSGQSGESETLAGTSNVGANAKAGAAKIHPIEAGATG